MVHCYSVHQAGWPATSGTAAAKVIQSVAPVLRREVGGQSGLDGLAFARVVAHLVGMALLVTTRYRLGFVWISTIPSFGSFITFCSVISQEIGITLDTLITTTIALFLAFLAHRIQPSRIYVANAKEVQRGRFPLIANTALPQAGTKLFLQLGLAISEGFAQIHLPLALALPAAWLKPAPAILVWLKVLTGKGKLLIARLTATLGGAHSLLGQSSRLRFLSLLAFQLSGLTLALCAGFARLARIAQPVAVGCTASKIFSRGRQQLLAFAALLMGYIWGMISHVDMRASNAFISLTRDVRSVAWSPHVDPNYSTLGRKWQLQEAYSCSL